MTTFSLPTTNPDPLSLPSLVVQLLEAEHPRLFSIAPLEEWIWVLLARCAQEEQPEAGKALLLRFWDELEAVGPLDRLEQTMKQLMPRMRLTPSEKLHFGDLWVRLLIEQGRWLRARQLLQKLDTLALSPKERARYANRMGVYFKERSEFEQSERYLLEALALGQSTHDDERVIISLNNLGNLEFNRDHFEQSIAYFEAIQHHPAAAQFPRWQGAAAAGLAMNWAGQKDFARAAAIMDEAERLYGAYRPGVLRVWVNRAYYEARAGNLQNAFLYGTRALALARELKEPRRESFALHNLGVAHYQAGEPRAAIHYLEQALELRKTLAMPLLIETTLEMLAEVQLTVDK